MSVYPRELWLKTLQFEQDPFLPEARRAEGDVLLKATRSRESAFIEFPYYFEILGKTDTPGPCFVFSPRGGGKTALRQTIFDSHNDNFSKSGPIMPIMYDDFNLVLERAGHDPDAVKPRYHVEQIIRLIVQRLFRMAIYEDLDEKRELKNIKNRHQKSLLVWYINTFGGFHPWELNRILGETEGASHFLNKANVVELGKKTIEVAAEIVGPRTARLVSFFNEMVNVDKFEEVKPDTISMYDLLKGLVSVCNEIGIREILVLVDDIDEPQYYSEQGDFKPAYSLIRSLIASPKLLGLPGLVFKFFLPMEMKDDCLRVVRLDKFAERTVVWNYQDLWQVLKRRLEISGGQTTLGKLCLPGDEFGACIDDALVNFAVRYKNPRALIYIGNELLAEHFRSGPRQADQFITRQTWNMAEANARKVLGPPLWRV